MTEACLQSQIIEVVSNIEDSNLNDLQFQTAKNYILPNRSDTF